MFYKEHHYKGLLVKAYGFLSTSWFKNMCTFYKGQDRYVVYLAVSLISYSKPYCVMTFNKGAPIIDVRTGEGIANYPKFVDNQDLDFVEVAKNELNLIDLMLMNDHDLLTQRLHLQPRTGPSTATAAAATSAAAAVIIVAETISCGGRCTPPRRTGTATTRPTRSSCPATTSGTEILALKHESRILRHSSNPVCGFSMMEQVRLCAVWPMENWLGSSLNQIQGWTTVRESYSRALEQGPLFAAQRFSPTKLTGMENFIETHEKSRTRTISQSWGKKEMFRRLLKPIRTKSRLPTVRASSK